MVFTPDWFLNNDVLIGIVSFMVLFLLFLFAVKSYALNKKKSILYLGVGFFLIALGELSTILTKFVLYYDTNVTQQIGKVVMTTQLINTVDIFYSIGFFFQKFLTLSGLYLIYKIPSEKKLTGESLLILYLLLIIALFSTSMFYVYHLTALAILVLIVRYYYKNYKEKKLVNTKILLIAFLLLALSQAIFLLSAMNNFYVTAQGIQLVSYITLFVLITKILLKNGKKKKPNRHNA
tara:strand:+ start:211 stop:915 length:705 start_codon:yes stop_codon:yes gene_type:complete